VDLPRPAGTLNEWADAVVYVSLQYANVSQLDGDDWKAWGHVFFNSPQLGNLHPPDPYAFDTWQEWGERLVDALSSGRGSPSKMAP
jgi:hypothetical protein